jgi:hypothetical protein
MTMKRFGLFFFFSIFFILLLAGEYLYCSMNFRFIRTWDLWGSDLICGFLSIVFSYGLFKKLIKEALKEKIPSWVILAFFLLLSFLFGCFLRFNLQIVNGLLDGSGSETKLVYITHKETSAFGGSIKNGLNAIAYYVYFADWDDKDKICELLVSPADYYFVGSGTKVELAMRMGFLHIPWIEEYRIVSP